MRAGNWSLLVNIKRDSTLTYSHQRDGRTVQSDTIHPEAEQALTVARQWQPIETAPKDGTVILAWSEDSKQAEFIWWAGGAGEPCWVLRDEGTKVHVDWLKGWMPLPDPPQATQEAIPQRPPSPAEETKR